MHQTTRTAGIGALAWGLLSLSGFALIALAARARRFDSYDVQAGLQALSQQPLLVIGAQVLFAWAGTALIILALAFHDWLPRASPSSPARAAVAFGLIAGALFLFFGLVGGFSTADLAYIQSVRTAAYVPAAYLPLSLVMNRAFSAAITVSGLWFALSNWDALGSRALPPLLALLGLVAGALALPGRAILMAASRRRFQPSGSILERALGPPGRLALVAQLIRASLIRFQPPCNPFQIRCQPPL